jgi:hypothetical protein
MPHIYVIGFEIFGGTSGRLVATAGQVYEDLFGTTSLRVMKDLEADVPLTEHSYFSKWALDGKIIRFPRTEQSDRDKKKCANPSCPGHPVTNEKCDVFP